MPIANLSMYNYHPGCKQIRQASGVIWYQKKPCLSVNKQTKGEKGMLGGVITHACKISKNALKIWSWWVGSSQ